MVGTPMTRHNNEWFVTMTLDNLPYRPSGKYAVLSSQVDAELFAQDDFGDTNLWCVGNALGVMRSS